METALTYQLNAGNSRTDGRGFRATETKRRGKFLSAVRTLSIHTDELDELQYAAHTVSDFLVDHFLSKSDRQLPRGYEIAANKAGASSLKYGATLFGPDYSEPLPDRAAVIQLGNDLRTGWLREVSAQVGIDLQGVVSQ